VIEFTVTPEGKVSSPKIVHSTDKLFNRSALRGIEKFKYKPRHKDGRPVAVPGVRAKIAFDYEETSHPDHCN